MTRGFGRFLAAVLLVGVLCVGSAFAAYAEKGTNALGTQEIQSIPRLIAFLSGAIPGGIIMVKFMFDMVKAYGNREQNPQGIQKAVVNFLIVVGVLLCYVVVIKALFKEDSGDTEMKTDGNKILTGVSGAEVSPDWLAERGLELPAEGDVLWAEGGVE